MVVAPLPRLHLVARYLGNSERGTSDINRWVWPWAWSWAWCSDPSRSVAGGHTELGMAAGTLITVWCSPTGSVGGW
jgi:hypothetical protein